jgi:hypothetical protein
MYETDTGHAVRESLRALAKRPEVSVPDEEVLLQQRIFAAVEELKAMGWPIERIIVRIKEVASEVGVPLGHTRYAADRHPAVANAILWCAERYYRKDEAK